MKALNIPIVKRSWSIRLFMVGAMFFIISCGSNKETAPTNEKKVNRVQTLIEEMEFEIENQWAMPRTGDRVSLIGNENHIRIKGDSVDVHLPYFGVRQMADRHPRDNSIMYKGIAENLRVEEKNGETRIRFETDDRQENFQFNIRIAVTGNTNTNVNSSHRDGISYQGYISKIDEGKE